MTDHKTNRGHAPMSFRLTMTIEFSGDDYPVLQAAGDIDTMLERMGPVTARDADGDPVRIDGKIEGRPVAIHVTTKEEYL